MAVETRHRNQLFFSNNNSEIMNPVQANGGMHGSQISYGGLVTMEALLSSYNNNMNDSMLPNTTPFPARQSDSGLTYNVPISTTRKRSRVDPNPNLYTNNNNTFSFLGEDISRQLHHQQADIDQYITHHMEKVRAEIEFKRKSETRRIMECIDSRMMKRLRAKEAEMEKIGKLNWALEEKVKSLCNENQIWRDLALTNEATANTLRTNLEQVMADVKHNNVNDYEDEDRDDDVESCCGSRGNDEDGGGGSRLCRNCGEEESCVLVLPCRHLCLCTACGSTLHVCPVCKSTKIASVHVNLC